MSCHLSSPSPLMLKSDFYSLVSSITRTTSKRRKSRALIYITTLQCFGLFVCLLVSTNAYVLFKLGLFHIQETNCLTLILENMQCYLQILTIQNTLFQHQKSDTTHVEQYSVALFALPVSKTALPTMFRFPHAAIDSHDHT